MIADDNRAHCSPVEETVLLSRDAFHHHPVSAMTLEEVDRVVGVTQECVRQIQNKVFARLRAALESETLTGLLE
jgi:DNA-directed RNA polymerase sigma subunit (sigma70/sigma32)